MEEWSEYAGKYVLIKGDEVFGFFSSYDDALNEGYKKFRLNTFFVKQINALEQVHFVSRLFDPCHTSPSK